MSLRLGVCAECLKHGDQSQVYLVDSAVNEGDEYEFNCQRHGHSRCIFVSEPLKTYLIHQQLRNET
jgi:hypothetical protein